MKNPFSELEKLHIKLLKLGIPAFFSWKNEWQIEILGENAETLFTVYCFYEKAFKSLIWRVKDAKDVENVFDFFNENLTNMNGLYLKGKK